MTAAAALGFEHVEVSNNRGRIPRSAIRPLIDKARAAGFSVFGEVGSEVERTAFGDMVRDLHECLAAGAEKGQVVVWDADL